MSTATAEPKKKSTIAPFAIEVDNQQNSDHSIASIPGCKLRGCISHRPKMGADYARGMATCPEIPGVHLQINPEQCKWRIEDPIYGDRSLCDEIRTHLSTHSGTRIHQVDGIEPTEGSIDVHRMKTLCREVFHMIERGACRVVKGPTPKMEDIDNLPGYYLANPGSRTQWNMPVYEKDIPAWQAALSRGG